MKMLDVIAAILLFAWLVNVARGGGGFVHILLLMGLAFVSIRLVRYRRERQR